MHPYVPHQNALPEKPFQYRLWHLFAVMTVLAIVTAAFAQLGLQAVYPLVAGAGVILVILGSIRRDLLPFMLVGIPMVLVALLMPAVGSGPPSRRSACANNLKQIGIALHLYHDVYGSYPPAFVADKNGRPMHSWRVLLLPFLEQEPLYRLYRFDEPWDGPHNRKLAELAKNFEIFTCPAQKPGDLAGETSYVVVIGPHTAFPGEKCVSKKDIQDSLGGTLTVVEVHHSGIHWMEPRDLHVLQMAPAISSKSGQGISSAHKNGAQAVTADASVHFLPADSISTELLRGLLSIDGGEKVEIP